MANFDAYKARVHQRGDTERDRTLYYEKEYLKELAINSLSCKPCEVDGVEQSLVIDDGTLPYYKDIKSLPDEYFDAGNLVKFADAMWLIVSCDWDKEVYTYGKMQQCNYLLKWQNKQGEIIERWCVATSASKYNNGEINNNIITIQSNQTMIYLPIDSETLKLNNDKRVFLDFNTQKPKTYSITRVDTVTMGYDGVAEPVYNGIGCILLIVTECEYNPDTDRIDLMICDYIDPNSVKPTSPIEISHSGNASVRIGGRKIFSASEEVVFSLITSSEWANKITLTTLSGTSCRIYVALDSNLVGASFKVVAAGNGKRAELLVEVEGAV